MLTQVCVCVLGHVLSYMARRACSHAEVCAGYVLAYTNSVACLHMLEHVLGHVLITQQKDLGAYR